MPVPRKNPCELEIDLFCNGARLDPSCTLEEDARRVARTRAGLGSGLEIVIPGRLKDLWMNVPVEEDFAAASPYVVGRDSGGYHVHDTRTGTNYVSTAMPMSAAQLATSCAVSSSACPSQRSPVISATR